MEGIIYRCAGARIFSAEEHAAGHVKRDKIHANASLADLRTYAEQLAAALERAHGVQNPDSADSTDWDSAILRLLNARAGCGTIMTELVQAVPKDGRPHPVACPTCGTVARVVREPETAEEQAAAAAAKRERLAQALR